MALAMLTAIEPKFTRRYERLERMHQARNQVALRSAASHDEQVAEAGDESAEPIAINSGGGSLRPIMLFLAGLMFAAVLAMVVMSRRTEATS